MAEISRIKEFRIFKVERGTYKGKYFATFYFDDKSIRPLRVFGIADKAKKQSCNQSRIVYEET